ncbi:MAG TPA: ABC transporter substrate-binding protein [Casimicrobiaceae bacterium]|nr:ABC transporter substrate-binding protein [Casimicrobiaceae bacterium]
MSTGASSSLRILVIAAAVFTLSAEARGEANEIRFAKQFSMGYVQFNVLEHHKLIEKHARAMGLGEVKVTWSTFNGPDAMNTALLSDQVDVVAGGVPGLVTLWSKTAGTAQEVRGISALSSQPFLLNTRNAGVKSIRDFSDADRIAVPTVGVSVQAVTLQMACAQTFGKSSYNRLDKLTVSMSPPDATVALLTGSGLVSSAFSVPPFQQQQLENPAIHTVLNSFDVLGGSHSFTVAWTSRKFHDANPKLYRALLDALAEATQVLNADKRAAAALWIEDSKSKLPLDMVYSVLAGTQVKWTLVPENTMKYASFMKDVGSIKTAPSSWKDLFFPEIQGEPGS